MRFALSIAALLLLLTSCTHDPTSPDTSSKGIISGNVIVYDKTLTDVSDHSGVVVTYVDATGKTYTATTQSDGAWKMELPYGVYRLVSITKPGYTYLDGGSGKQTPPTGHLDWMGIGERQVLYNTRLMPVELDTTSQILSVDVAVDTTAIDPANSGWAQYHVSFNISVSMKYGAAQHRLEASIYGGDGKLISTPHIDLRGTFDTTLVINVTKEDYLNTLEPLKGATLDLKISSEIDVYRFEGDATGISVRKHEKVALAGRQMTVPISF